MTTLEQYGISEEQLEISAIRSQGKGGQNVNKVATAIHLRFDINTSLLSDFIKQRLLKHRDSRISKDGVIIIKAQQHRSQEKNKILAMQRLEEIIQAATVVQKKRIASKPSFSAKRKRLDNKNKRSQLKKGRGKVSHD